MGLREVRSRVAPRSSQRREARSPRLQVCLDSRSARACKVSLQNTAKHVCCDGVLLSRLALQCPCARVAHGDCIPAIVCYPNSGLSPYPTGTAQSLLNFQSCSDVPRKRGPSHGTSHGSVGRRTGRPTSRIRLASTCVDLRRLASRIRDVARPGGRVMRRQLLVAEPSFPSTIRMRL